MLHPIVRTHSRFTLHAGAVVLAGLVAVGALVCAPRTLLGTRSVREEPVGRCQDVTAAPVRAADQTPDDPMLAVDIHTFDAQHHLVARRLVERALANPLEYAKGARIVPAVADGRPVGFKLYAIKDGSVYQRLGFENGDTLLSINGFDLTSADKALETYTKLREASTFVIDVKRHGELLQLVVAVE